MSFQYFFNFLSAGFLAFWCVAATAIESNAVVAEGLGVSVTAGDLEADALQRLPPASRAQVLSRAELVQQAASNIFVRRALAAEAERDGLANDPVVIAALRLVRDRVLSDAKLARIDAANKPLEEAVEAAARAAYRSNPGKYLTASQARVRHILIEGNTEKAKVNAEKVLADLKSGANFEDLAKQLSADPGSSPAGGDLGYFEAGKMVPEFDQAVQALKQPGEISGLVQTKFGWHIIKLEGRRPGGQRTYEEVRAELRQMVGNQLQSDARLREATRIASDIKFNNANIEAFSAPYRK